jgi:hypothetical protein
MNAAGSSKTVTTMYQTAEGCNVDMNRHPCSSNYMVNFHSQHPNTDIFIPAVNLMFAVLLQQFNVCIVLLQQISPYALNSFVEN